MVAHNDWQEGDKTPGWVGDIIVQIVSGVSVASAIVSYFLAMGWLTKIGNGFAIAGRSIGKSCNRFTNWLSRRCAVARTSMTDWRANFALDFGMSQMLTGLWNRFVTWLRNSLNV